VFRRIDWSPVATPDAVVRVNEFVNDALEEVTSKAPFAMLEMERTINTIKPHDMASTTDLVSSSSSNSDPWVIQRDTAPSALAAADVWAVDGTWDGHQIQVKDANAVWRTHRIRTVWTASDVQYVSLYNPMDDRTVYSANSYYLHQPILWLPDDAIRLETLRLYTASQSRPMRGITQKTAEELYLKDMPDLVETGYPSFWYKWGSFQMPTPGTAPATAVTGVWSGTVEPEGTFQYCYTWCWGYMDLRQPGITPKTAAIGPLARPLFESAPSPASTALATAGSSINITIPKLDIIHNFGVSGTDRYQKTGWYTRIYRRRTARSGTNVEITDRWHPMTHAASTVSIVGDDGIWAVDRSQTLPANDGHLGIGLYPRADANYPVVLRYHRRCPTLVDDADTAPIHREVDEVLVEYVLAKLYEMQGDQASAAIARARGDGALRQFRKVYGPDVADSTVMHKRSARGRGRRYSAHQKWWD